MKRYIRAAKSNEPNYNYYLLDFLKKLGVSDSALKALQDRSGNLRDNVHFGRGYDFNWHGFQLSYAPNVNISYYTLGHVGIGDTFTVRFVASCRASYRWSDDEIASLKNEGHQVITHILDVAESCDYVESASDIREDNYTREDMEYSVRLIFRKPETYVNKKKTTLDKYVDAYGLEFVYMVGNLFDRDLNSDLIDDEPYRTKIAESGCSVQELKDMARYLHNNVEVGVDSYGTYSIYPRSASATGSSVTYELPYKEYNKWLGKDVTPTISLGRLGSIPLPLEEDDE